MVHALEKVHSLLAENGRFLDIHPHPDEPEIVVQLGDETHLVGWLHETDDRVEYGQADQALANVVQRDFFRVQQRETFMFHTYADSVEALQDYLAENWQDAVIDDRVAMQIKDLLNSPKSGVIVLRERVRIAALRPLRP